MVQNMRANILAANHFYKAVATRERERVMIYYQTQEGDDTAQDITSDTN